MPGDCAVRPLIEAGAEFLKRAAQAPADRAAEEILKQADAASLQVPTQVVVQPGATTPISPVVSQSKGISRQTITIASLVDAEGKYWPDSISEFGTRQDTYLLSKEYAKPYQVYADNANKTATILFPRGNATRNNQQHMKVMHFLSRATEDQLRKLGVISLLFDDQGELIGWTERHIEEANSLNNYIEEGGMLDLSSAMRLRAVIESFAQEVDIPVRTATELVENITVSKDGDTVDFGLISPLLFMTVTPNEKVYPSQQTVFWIDSLLSSFDEHIVRHHDKYPFLDIRRATLGYEATLAVDTLRQEKNPPIKPGETFDADAEVNFLRQTDNRNRTAQDRETLRAKVEFQKNGVRLLRNDLVVFIQQHPEAWIESVYVIYMRYQRVFGFPESYWDSVYQSFREYKQKVNNVNHLRVRNSLEQIFERAFGFRPTGRIEIHEYDAGIVFSIYHEDDWVRAYNGTADIPVEKFIEYKSRADSVAGFYGASRQSGEMSGIVIAVNRTRPLDQNRVGDIITHEYSHLLHSVFTPGVADPDLEYASSEHMGVPELLHRIPIMIQNFVFQIERRVRNMAKDEIFAKLRGGTNPEDVLTILKKRNTNNVGYDYITDNKQKYLETAVKAFSTYGWAVRTYAKWQFHRLYGTQRMYMDYESTLAIGLGAYQTLLSKGYSREEALIRFEREPLEQWSSVARRAPVKNLTVFSEAIPELLRRQSVTDVGVIEGNNAPIVRNFRELVNNNSLSLRIASFFIQPFLNGKTNEQKIDRWVNAAFNLKYVAIPIAFLVGLGAVFVGYAALVSVFPAAFVMLTIIGQAFIVSMGLMSIMFYWTQIGMFEDQRVLLKNRFRTVISYDSEAADILSRTISMEGFQRNMLSSAIPNQQSKIVQGGNKVIEEQRFIVQVAPAEPEIAVGVEKDGCSECSFIDRFIKVEYPEARKQIQALIGLGEHQQALQIVERLEARYPYFMRNRMVQTTFDAAVSVLRVEANPLNAEQEAALRKIAQARELTRRELLNEAQPTDVREALETVNIPTLERLQTDTRSIQTTEATIFQRISLGFHRFGIWFRRLIGTPIHRIQEARRGAEGENASPEMLQGQPEQQSEVARELARIIQESSTNFNDITTLANRDGRTAIDQVAMQLSHDVTAFHNQLSVFRRRGTITQVEETFAVNAFLGMLQRKYNEHLQRFENGILYAALRVDHEGETFPINYVITRYLQDLAIRQEGAIPELIGVWEEFLDQQIKRDIASFRTQYRGVVAANLVQAFLKFREDSSGTKIPEADRVALVNELKTLLNNHPEVLDLFVEYFLDPLHQKELTELERDQFPKEALVAIKDFDTWLAKLNKTGRMPQLVWNSQSWPILKTLGWRILRVDDVKGLFGINHVLKNPLLRKLFGDYVLKMMAGGFDRARNAIQDGERRFALLRVVGDTYAIITLESEGVVRPIADAYAKELGSLPILSRDGNTISLKEQIEIHVQPTTSIALDDIARADAETLERAANGEAVYKDKLPNLRLTHPVLNELILAIDGMGDGAPIIVAFQGYLTHVGAAILTDDVLEETAQKLQTEFQKKNKNATLRVFPDLKGFIAAMVNQFGPGRWVRLVQVSFAGLKHTNKDFQDVVEEGEKVGDRAGDERIQKELKPVARYFSERLKIRNVIIYHKGASDFIVVLPWWRWVSANRVRAALAQALEELEIHNVRYYSHPAISITTVKLGTGSTKTARKATIPVLGEAIDVLAEGVTIDAYRYINTHFFIDGRPRPGLPAWHWDWLRRYLSPDPLVEARGETRLDEMGGRRDESNDEVGRLRQGWPPKQTSNPSRKNPPKKH